MTGILRAAIVGPGRIGSTYDDAVDPKHPAEFFQGEHRHPGLYTIHPVNHAAAYRSVPGYMLNAVVGRDPGKLHAFAERWSVRPFVDLEEMLAASHPDVVSICTQSDNKADLTIRIARAGAGVKAIIVEKAMASSMNEADAMIAACRDAGILLVVNHPYRFSPMVREIRALLSEGVIGDLGTISAWSRGGTLHVGTHVFDVMRLLAGDMTEIVALGEPVTEWTDQGASVIVRFASGAVGFVSLDRPAMAGFDLRGPRGQITFSTNVGDAWQVQTDLLDPANQRPYPVVARRTAIGEGVNDMSTTQRLLSEVRDALQSDGPMISTGEDGAAALEAGIASLIARNENAPISLPLATKYRDVTVWNR